MWKDLLNTQTLITVGLLIVLALVIAYAIMVAKSSTEGYSNMSNGSYPLAPANYPPVNTFKPAYYEPELGILTSASDFIGMPTEVIPAWTDDINDPKTNQKRGNQGLGYSMCSKSCCSPQYPPPFSLPKDDLVLNSGQEFVGTSYACSNTWQDAGCLCMTKEQGKFLDSHGGNK